MVTDKYQLLACPLDGLNLQLQDRSLKCHQGHHYDLARQGYVNLLPVQQKKSREPGDSKEMIAARKRFLDGAYYAPIATRLSELSCAYLPPVGPASCLDAGCGEGYYLAFFRRHLEQMNRQDVQFTGLDISKDAIIAAAKRDQSITWVVGNSQHAPVMPASMDMIWSVFGFHHLSGFKNMLRQHGKLIMVEAGAEHLIEIRTIIYPDIKPVQVPLSAVFSDAGFKQIDSQRLTYQSPELLSAQLADLLLMTPHLFRASRAGKEAMAKVSSLPLTVDVTFQVYELMDYVNH